MGRNGRVPLILRAFMIGWGPGRLDNNDIEFEVFTSASMLEVKDKPEPVQSEEIGKFSWEPSSTTSNLQ